MSDFNIVLTDMLKIINELFNDDINVYDWETICSFICMKIDDSYLDEKADYFVSRIKSDNQIQKNLSKFDNEKCINRDCNICPINKYCNFYIKETREQISNNSLSLVDLFCGAGGLSLGFKNLGFVTSLACDIDGSCIETYAHNHPETPREYIVNDDINNILNEIESLLMQKSIDVVVGGPPCQGFSMANRQRVIDDPRNKLYKSFIKAVEKINPKFVVMENVKGMLSVADQIVEDFKTIGFDANYRILNARDYGVPQNRERIIFIANRNMIDNNRIFEKIIFKNRFVLNDALFGLRELDASTTKNSTNLDTEASGRKIEANLSKESNGYLDLINNKVFQPIVYNHKARYNNDRDIEIFRRLNPGDRSDNPKIADIMPYKSRNHIFKDKYFKLDGKKLCKTITAHMKFDCNMYIHPSQARGLTPREAARVQSFPDDYYFLGPYTKTYMQIGNSVPPLLGRAIAYAIRESLMGDKDGI